MASDKKTNTLVELSSQLSAAVEQIGGQRRLVCERALQR